MRWLLAAKSNYYTMAQSIRNQVQLIGHLGQDPESTTFDGGKVKTNLRLATNHKYRNADGELQDETDWHNVVLWDKPASLADKYLKKGSEVAVQGRLASRSYEKEGQTRYVIEVVANELMFMGKKD